MWSVFLKKHWQTLKPIYAKPGSYKESLALGWKRGNRCPGLCAGTTVPFICRMYGCVRLLKWTVILRRNRPGCPAGSKVMRMCPVCPVCTGRLSKSACRQPHEVFILLRAMGCFPLLVNAKSQCGSRTVSSGIVPRSWSVWSNLTCAKPFPQRKSVRRNRR